MLTEPGRLRTFPGMTRHTPNPTPPDATAAGTDTAPDHRSSGRAAASTEQQTFGPEQSDIADAEAVANSSDTDASTDGPEQAATSPSSSVPTDGRRVRRPVQLQDLDELRAQRAVVVAQTLELNSGYESFVRTFDKWVEAEDPDGRMTESEQLLGHLTARLEDGLRPKSLRVILNAVQARARRDGLPDPDSPQIRSLIEGATRIAPTRNYAGPLTLDELRTLVETMTRMAENGALGPVRERAHALIAAHNGRLPTTLQNLRRSHCAQSNGGWVLNLRQRATRRIGRQLPVVLVPAADPVLCPVRAFESWLRLVDQAARQQGVADPYVFCKIPAPERLDPGTAASTFTISVQLRRFFDLAGLDAERPGTRLADIYPTQALGAGRHPSEILDVMGAETLNPLRRLAAHDLTADDPQGLPGQETQEEQS